MKCHYEVLNVSREADDSEIKAAYRKLALKWHPDKNLDNADLAKEQFQLVQQAYEVLSDKQERAWYDKHREQILRGADKDYEDNSLDVFPYFTTSCFKGYTDDENGFYTVYRNVFEKIAKEDMEYMDKEEFCQIPGFGDSKSTYEDVVGPFYDYWMSYSTKKSYVWLDPYDIKEIRDRRAVKLVEKENKKVRQKAKKERNEEVRNLVAFVRKRDKRVQNHVKMMKEKSVENRKKQEMMRKQKKLEQQQHLGSVEQPEWAKFDNVKSELEEIEKALAEQFGEEISASEDEQAPEENDLYCVACNKVFKTPKAFSNHESSKKHKENVELLRANMEEDDDINESENENDYLDDLSIEHHADIDLPHSDEIDDEIEETKSKNKKKKKKKALNIADSEETEHLQIELNESDENEDFDNSITKSKKKSKRNKKMKNEPAKDIPEKIEEEEKEKEATTNKKPNKKDKKQKKEKDGSAEIDTDHCCATCKANFPSKNKLFDHLKKTNHGIYLPSKSKQKNVN